MAIVIRGVDHPSLTDDEDVVVLILGAAETEALTKVMDALDRLFIGPMVAAHQGWPSLASLRDGLVGDGDE